MAPKVFSDHHSEPQHIHAPNTDAHAYHIYIHIHIVHRHICACVCECVSVCTHTVSCALYPLM